MWCVCVGGEWLTTTTICKHAHTSANTRPHTLSTQTSLWTAAASALPAAEAVSASRFVCVCVCACPCSCPCQGPYRGPSHCVCVCVGLRVRVAVLMAGAVVKSSSSWIRNEALRIWSTEQAHTHTHIQWRVSCVVRDVKDRTQKYFLCVCVRVCLFAKVALQALMRCRKDASVRWFVAAAFGSAQMCLHMRPLMAGCWHCSCSSCC